MLKPIVATLVLLIATSPLFAEGPQDAKAHYEHGVSLYALGDYAGAADEYEKAFALKSDPALLYDAAQAHRRAGHNARALALYENYLALFGDQVPNRKEVQRKIEELHVAVEAERKVQTSPPMEPVPMQEHAPVETAPPAVVAVPQDSLTTTPPAPPPPRSRRLTWLLVGAGAVVVVGVGLGVGLGIGLSKTVAPSPSFGAVPVTAK